VFATFGPSLNGKTLTGDGCQGICCLGKYLYLRGKNKLETDKRI